MVLEARPDAPLVAGLPPAVRSAVRAGLELAPVRIVIAGAGDAFFRKWAVQLKAAGAPVLGDETGPSALDPGLPLLALDPSSFPDEGALREFAAAAAGGDARRLRDGLCVAALRRGPGELG
ncbi:MAG: hypothetical protein NUW21_02230, partial [Elusimicrobia bacterium]|nr:hypothetical protein [Elusimicrobiota bacterium]